MVDASHRWNLGCFGSISCPIIVFLFGIKQINFSSWDIFSAEAYPAASTLEFLTLLQVFESYGEQCWQNISFF